MLFIGYGESFLYRAKTASLKHSAHFDTGNEKECMEPDGSTDCEVQRGRHTLVSECVSSSNGFPSASGYDIVSVTLKARATSIWLG